MQDSLAHLALSETTITAAPLLSATPTASEPADAAERPADDAQVSLWLFNLLDTHLCPAAVHLPSSITEAETAVAATQLPGVLAGPQLSPGDCLADLLSTLQAQEAEPAAPTRLPVLLDATAVRALLDASVHAKMGPPPPRVLDPTQQAFDPELLSLPPGA